LFQETFNGGREDSRKLVGHSMRRRFEGRKLKNDVLRHILVFAGQACSSDLERAAGVWMVKTSVDLKGVRWLNISK
jgi:hypothetical protein